MTKLSTTDVLKILAEATSGPISSSPAPANQNTEIGQDMNEPKPVDQGQIKNLVQEAIKNIGKKLNVTPEQIPDFNQKFQNEIQQQLTELQNRAKTQQKNMLG